MCVEEKGLFLAISMYQTMFSFHRNSYHTPFVIFRKRNLITGYFCFNLQLIGPQFIQAIQPSLENQWNAELDEAWTKLFQYIAHIMKDSIATEEFYNKK